MEVWSSTPTRQQQLPGRQRPWPREPTRCASNESFMSAAGDDADDGRGTEKDREPLLHPAGDRDDVPGCGCGVVATSALNVLWYITVAPTQWLFFSDHSVSPPATPHVAVMPSSSSIVSAHTDLRQPAVAATAVDHEKSPHYKQFHPGVGYEALSPPPSMRTSSLVIDGDAASQDPRLSDKGEREREGVDGGAGERASPMSPPTVTRGPIFTVLELRHRIESLQPWLPVQVRVEGVAVPAASPAPRRYQKPQNAALHGSGNSGTPTFLQQSTTSTSRLQESQAHISLCLTICGPIRRPIEKASVWRRRLAPLGVVDWEPPGLGDIEDLVVEDTIGMTVTGLQLQDLDLTRNSYAEPKSKDGHTYRADVNRSPEAALMLAGESDDDNDDEPYDVAVARVLGMAQNFMAQMTEQHLRRRESHGLAAATAAVQLQGLGLRLHLVRCQLSPNDLLDALRLPDHLEALVFQQCPIVDAHVLALLRRARQSESFFEVLRCLKLSGNLSQEAVRWVLRYFDEEVEHPVLSELVVPSSGLAVATGHPIVIRLPALLVNGRSASELRGGGSKQPTAPPAV